MRRTNLFLHTEVFLLLVLLFLPRCAASENLVMSAGAFDYLQVTEIVYDRFDQERAPPLEIVKVKVHARFNPDSAPLKYFRHPRTASAIFVDTGGHREIRSPVIEYSHIIYPVDETHQADFEFLLPLPNRIDATEISGLTGYFVVYSPVNKTKNEAFLPCRPDTARTVVAGPYRLTLNSIDTAPNPQYKLANISAECLGDCIIKAGDLFRWTLVLNNGARYPMASKDGYGGPEHSIVKPGFIVSEPAREIKGFQAAWRDVSVTELPFEFKNIPLPE